MEGKYDDRNKVNDLTGKEWLKLTKSFWLSEKCADDKDAFLCQKPPKHKNHGLNVSKLSF